MKNKVILMLILIFTFALGTSCFASISFDTLKAGIDYVVDVNTMTSLIGSYPPDNDVNFNNALNTYDNFVIESCYNNSTLRISLGYSLFKIDDTNNGCLGSSNITNNYFANNWYFDGTYLWNTNNTPYIYNINNGINNIAVSSDIYTDSTLTTVLYSSNIITTPPTPATPTISMEKSVYNETDSSIDVVISNNGYNGDYFVILRKFSPLQENLDICGINLDLSYYDSFTDSYTVSLNDFYNFTFDSGNYYVVYLRDSEGVIDESDSFKYMFSENYSVSDYDRYTVTPTIRVNPSEASTSKTVTITSSVENSTIYYKTSLMNSWVQYTEPFIITQNCTIYAHCYDSDGISSSLASYTVGNIVSVEDYSNRPTAGPMIKYFRFFEDGKRAVHVYIEDISDYDIQFSTDNINWYDFKDGARHSFGTFLHMDYNRIFYIDMLPIHFYFRYSDNGLYSPTSSFSIISFENDNGVLTTINSASQNAYDNNGNYISNNYTSSDFNGGWNSYLGNNIYNNDGTVNTGAIISNSMKSGWSFISELPTFFVIFQGLFIFIPDSIMAVIFAFLTIKFIIAIIGFLRG